MLVRSKILRVGYLAILISFLIPSVAHAAAGEWIEKKIADGIAYILTLIFKPLFDGCVQLLGALLKTTPDFDNLPLVPDLLRYIQILAYTFLAVTLAFRAWRFQVAAGTTGQVEPLPALLYRTIISAILIYGLPEIVKYTLRLRNFFIDLLAHLGVNFTSGLKLLMFPTGGGNILMITIFIVWTIALIFLSVSTSVMFAELCFLYVVAPIMAVSHTAKGEGLQIWITQLITAAFTPVFQCFCCGLALNFAVNIDLTNWFSWIAPIGAVVLAIKGPQTLKQYLYSTGVGGATASMAQTGVGALISRYSRMLKVGK